jgi:hypothetical protein
MEFGLMTEHNLPDKDDAPWLNTQYDGFMTHEEMIEIAAEREAAMKAVEKLYAENGDALQQLADIEKEERMDAVRTAIAGIDKYSDALKELRKIEHEELVEELQAKKKENFQLVADACMKEYEEKYGRDVFPMSEYWVYMVSEYFGTGEGQTVCVMMTQANPGHPEDFETSTNKYVACTTKQYRAVRAFHEQFGTWHLHGLRFLSKEDFFTECAYYIPPVMMKLSNKNCFKEFHTKVHYNFS